MKKKLFAGLVLSAVLCAGTATATVIAGAEGEAPATPTLAFETGASVRLGEDDGIRFICNVDGWQEGDEYTYGMYIVKANAELAAMTEFNAELVGTAYAEISDAAIKTAGGKIRGVYTGATMGASFADNYGDDIQAVAVVKNAAGEVVDFAVSDARSARTVATGNFNDHTQTFSGTQVGYLANYMTNVSELTESEEAVCYAYVTDGEETYRLVDGKTYTRNVRINAENKKVVICGSGTMDFVYGDTQSDDTAMSVYASQLIVGYGVTVNANANYSGVDGYAHAIALVGRDQTSELFGKVKVTAPEDKNAVYLKNGASVVLHNQFERVSGKLYDEVWSEWGQTQMGGQFVLGSETYEGDWTIEGEGHLLLWGSTVNGNVSATGEIAVKGATTITADKIVANAIKLDTDCTELTLVRNATAEGDFVTAANGNSISLTLLGGTLNCFNLGGTGVNAITANELEFRKGGDAKPVTAINVVNFSWLYNGAFNGKNDNGWENTTVRSINGEGIIYITSVGDWTKTYSGAPCDYRTGVTEDLSTVEAIKAYLATLTTPTGSAE